ncbi:WD40-repeat-containing domain protein [Fomes fomentarius]|nr:WD40-repeat-containing domain protein [Fomes fomentarius]
MSTLFPVLHAKRLLTLELCEVDVKRPLARYSHNNSVTALAATPDGLWIASGSSDGCIILWNMVNHDLSPVLDWSAHPEEIVELQFSPDGQCLASSSFSHIRIWDTVHGTQLATLLAGPKNDTDLTTFQLSCVNSMVWSPAGTIIAYGANGVLQWWDTNTLNSAWDQPSLGGGTQSSNGTAPSTVVLPDGSCHLTRPVLIETTKQPGAGHNIGDFTINSEPLLYSVLSLNGGRLTTTYQDGSIVIWNISELVDIPSSYKLSSVEQVTDCGVGAD